MTCFINKAPRYLPTSMPRSVLYVPAPYRYTKTFHKQCNEAGMMRVPRSHLCEKYNHSNYIVLWHVLLNHWAKHIRSNYMLNDETIMNCESVIMIMLLLIIIMWHCDIYSEKQITVLVIAALCFGNY